MNEDDGKSDIFQVRLKTTEVFQCDTTVRAAKLEQQE